MTAAHTAWAKRQQRTVPAELAELAPTLTANAARKHWSTGQDALLRWCEETGISFKKLPAQPKGGPPEWFKDVATLPRRELEATYGINKDTVYAWRKALGIKLKSGFQKGAHAASSARAANAAKRVAGTGSVKPAARRMGKKPSPPLVSARDATRAGMAADDLRRAGYARVGRAQIRDPKASPDDWIVGRRTLSTDEMMQLAAARARPHPFTTSTGASA